MGKWLQSLLAICVTHLALYRMPSVGATPQPLDVMPAPAGVTIAAGKIPVSAILEVSTAQPPGTRLGTEIEWARRRWNVRFKGSSGGTISGQAFTLSVACARLASQVPSASEDESYTLTVGEGHANLSAPTDIGALRGIETLLQLPHLDGGHWVMPSVSIRDSPRFPWRGLMIDVSRHWQPLAVIERNIDAMVVVKLNVLHLHLTDDQGFRIESLTHPELQTKGSDGNYFTQEQMRGLIAYAAERGIRVVPEFDIPGHATSWVVSHPELASLPGPYGIERHWGVFNPVLDPTKEATYALLADFLGEMTALFPDTFIHIGGDENNGVQWSANPRIQNFIKAHGLAGNAGLHAYFNGRIAAILAKNGKRLVGWDEIMNADLPKDSVIESWRGTEALALTAAAGLDALLANGFYIDLCYPASDHYVTDPLPASSILTPAQRAHVLGGEATMWAEWVSPETIDSRIWPRTAAIAERLWSPADIRDIPDMYRRLDLVSARLDEAGSLHLRNRDLMLRHLVGENLDAPGVDSLRTLTRLLEPVKHYERGDIQTWGNQLIPLVGLADAVAPESVPSRKFAAAVDRMLFGAAAIDVSQTVPIRLAMATWGAAGNAVVELSKSMPGVREAVPAATGLSSSCAVGAEAAEALAAGTPLGADRLSADLAVLDKAAAKNESATQLPLLKALRLLVAAAAKQSERPGLSDDAWHTLLTATALGASAAASRP
jgi:hexosaminidase